MDETTKKKINHILDTDYAPRVVADIKEGMYYISPLVAMFRKVPPKYREGAKFYASPLYVQSIGNIKVENWPIVQAITDMATLNGYIRVCGFIHEPVEFMPSWFETPVKGVDGRLYAHVGIFGNLDNYTINSDGTATFPEKSIQVFCLRKEPKSKASPISMEMG